MIFLNTDIACIAAVFNDILAYLGKRYDKPVYCPFIIVQVLCKYFMRSFFLTLPAIK